MLTECIFSIFRCILGHLREKLCILVTHQHQYLRSADRILVIKDGKCIASGSFADLENRGEEFTAIVQEMEESYKRQESVTSESSSTFSHSRPRTTSLSPKRMRSRDSETKEPDVDLALSGKRTQLDNRAELEELLAKAGSSPKGKLRLSSDSLNGSAWSLAVGNVSEIIAYRNRAVFGTFRVF